MICTNRERIGGKLTRVYEYVIVVRDNLRKEMKQKVSERRCIYSTLFIVLVKLPRKVTWKRRYNISVKQSI